MEEQNTDILIIGAGIAGSALACALRNSGLSIMLVDKSDRPLDTARGDHLQPHTCEIFHRWGVLDSFFARGAEKRLGARWFTGDGKEILCSSVAGLDVPHPYFTFINHELIAKTLLDLALESEHCSVTRPTRNWWLHERTQEHVVVKIGLSDGADKLVRAKLVVGADGRASRVRKAFNIAAESYAYDRGIAVFFAKRCVVDSDNFLHVYVDQRATTSVIPRTGGKCKIGFPIPRNEFRWWRGDNQEEIGAHISRSTPSLDIDALEFGDIYPPVFLRTPEWIGDRVVLVGDACHAMHPARSQGMNISLRCIERLRHYLESAASPFGAQEVNATLVAYQNDVKPTIDILLDQNHEFGKQMDNESPESYERLLGRLATVASSSSALHSYALNAAGYDIGRS